MEREPSPDAMIRAGRDGRRWAIWGAMAGGIGTRVDLERIVRAGASRIDACNGAQMMRGQIRVVS